MMKGPVARWSAMASILDAGAVADPEALMSLLNPGVIDYAANPPMEFIMTNRLQGPPTKSLLICTAKDGGFYVQSTDNTYDATRALVGPPITIYAGTLSACLNYIEEQMLPEGAAAPTPRPVF